MNPSEISDPVAAADQDTESLKRAAKAIAGFYRGLAEEQMPYDMVNDLCRDWFGWWLNREDDND